VIGAGGIIYGTNPSAPAAELLRLLQTTYTKFLITESTSLDVAEQVASSYGISPQHFFVLARCDQPVPAGRQAFIRLLNYGESDWHSFTTDDNGATSRTVAYCTTSGTTGLPKAAQIPHSYVVAQAEMIEQRLMSRTYEVRLHYHSLLTSCSANMPDSHRSWYVCQSIMPLRHRSALCNLFD
jgi:long-subunit acyl-CoA synthetase (AMP-forming)